jgi:CspA family cold shock protein
MNFRDKLVVDEDGEEFIFTVEMQRRLSESGLPVEPAYLKELAESSPGVHDDRPAQREPQPAPSRKPEARSEPDFSIPTTIQIDPQTGKYVGRMKWYNVKKGYGFIVRGGGEEIFFHKTGTVGDPQGLQEGQWILYDVEETHKGPEATDVEPYEGDVSLLT